MRPLTLVLASCLALGTAACGGDGVTDSDNTPSVVGTWQFNWNSLSGTYDGITVTCRSALNFTLSQTGTTFSGIEATPIGFISCDALGEEIINATVSDETIVNGQLNGTNVSFRLGSVNGNHTGTVSGTSMTGSGTWNIPQTVGGNLVLTGEWTAAKK